MKALVGAFNQEKALVGAFSVIVQLRRLIVYGTSTTICSVMRAAGICCWENIYTTQHDIYSEYESQKCQKTGALKSDN